MPKVKSSKTVIRELKIALDNANRTSAARYEEIRTLQQALREALEVEKNAIQDANNTHRERVQEANTRNAQLVEIIRWLVCPMSVLKKDGTYDPTAPHNSSMCPWPRSGL